MIVNVHSLRLKTTKYTNHTKEKTLARFRSVSINDTDPIQNPAYPAINKKMFRQDEHDLQDKMNTFQFGKPEICKIRSLSCQFEYVSVTR